MGLNVVDPQFFCTFLLNWHFKNITSVLNKSLNLNTVAERQVDQIVHNINVILIKMLYLLFFSVHLKYCKSFHFHFIES